MPPANSDFVLQGARWHQQCGRLSEAEALYRKALTDDPENAQALQGLGLLAAQAGKIPAALDLLTRVIQAAPQNAEAHCQLGFVLDAAGRTTDSIAALREAIRLQPDLVDAHANLGIALRKCGQLDDAIAVFREGLRITPAAGLLHYKLGSALSGAGRAEEAIVAFREAVRLMPRHVQARNDLGVVLQNEGELTAAAECFREALHLQPGSPLASYNLGNALRDLGLVEEAVVQYRNAVSAAPDRPERHSTLLLTLPYHPEVTGREILAAHREWDRRHAQPLASPVSFPGRDRSPDRPLRIGYVSPDLFDHPVGRNLLPLFREHDRALFHSICYSNAKVDAVNARLRSLAGEWRDTRALNQHALAELVRADQIDILVDLALHSEGNRLLAFARRPAPVQATFAGYPGGTGLSAIDYRLTDPWLDPPGADADYAETSLRLPHSFWCYDREGMTLGLPSEPEVSPPPAPQNGFITFGSLNNFAKVNRAVLTRWGALLQACPDSHLLMLAPRHAHDAVLRRLESLGVARARIELVARVPRWEYLRLFAKIDISLDTLPYNGHTTSLDSLWMGVPVVTLVGKTVVGRAGLSQLQNLELPELIAYDDEAFITIASGLAQDLDRLRALRSSLRERMKSSPLGDAAAFARGVENAYRTMWRRWCDQTA